MEEEEGKTFLQSYSIDSGVKFVSSFIGVECLLSIFKVCFGFPTIFGSGVAFPFDKVLVAFTTSPMGYNGFYLVFR